MSAVVVIGLGYVGLPLAVRAAEVGHNVIGIDLDLHKIAQLQSGSSYVEDVTDDLLGDVLRSGNFEAVTTSHVNTDFDIAIIAVPTPLREGAPDLSHVQSATEMVALGLRPGATVVLESTTYAGTTEGLVAEIIERARGLRPGVDYHLGYSPERIDPGNKQWTLTNTPKIISGTDDAALQSINAFYATVVDKIVPVSSPKVAEMAKIYENTFAQVNIALVNELAVLCHELGVDVWEMIEAANTKPHSMMRWVPGPGVGGHCVPIDTMYLAWQTRAQLGKRFRLGELAQSINDAMPQYVIHRASEVLNEHYKPLKGSKVLVLGLSYKPNVGDMRESPSIEIIDMLNRRGAHVWAADPHVTGWHATPLIEVEDLTARVDWFDLVIVATDHDAFDYGKIAESAQAVLDCKHRMERSEKVAVL